MSQFRYSDKIILPIPPITTGYQVMVCTFTAEGVWAKLWVFNEPVYFVYVPGNMSRDDDYFLYTTAENMLAASRYEITGTQTKWTKYVITDVGDVPLKWIDSIYGENDIRDGHFWTNHDIYRANKSADETALEPTDEVVLPASLPRLVPEIKNPGGIRVVSREALGLLGCLTGRSIALRRNKPPAMYCIYGTPSDSGNIGVRVGDTVTYYEGAVLPNVHKFYTPEMQTEFPFAVLQEGARGPSAYFLRIYGAGAYCFERNDRVYFGSVPSYDSGMAPDDEISVPYREYWADESFEYKWRHSNSSTDGCTGLTNNKQIWSNFDVSYNGNLIHSKSDPIPVGEIVEYIDGIPIYSKE